MIEDLLRFDKNKTLIFFDAETLNLCLNFCNNLPWQIAMLKVKNGEEVDYKDLYIKWDTNLKISKDAARITKYDQTIVDRNGIKPEQAFQYVFEWFKEADMIIGHNIIGFDIYIIKEFYELMKQDWKDLLAKFVDTNCLAKAVKTGIPKNGTDLTLFQFKLYHLKTRGIKTNLKFLGQEFGIKHDYENLHNALNDLRLNLQVWNKLKYLVDF